MIDAKGRAEEVFYDGILPIRRYLRTPEDFIIPSNFKCRGILAMREKDGRKKLKRKDSKIIFYWAIEVPKKLSRLRWVSITIHPSRLKVTFNFLNQLTSLDLSLCRRFQSLDELPTGLQAMDASNTTSLVWIFTGLNWELSKQLQCFGCSKVLKKNRTSNPKNKLLNVSLLSLFLFDRIWFLDQNSLLMILMY